MRGANVYSLCCLVHLKLIIKFNLKKKKFGTIVLLVLCSKCIIAEVGYAKGAQKQNCTYNVAYRQVHSRAEGRQHGNHGHVFPPF